MNRGTAKTSTAEWAEIAPTLFNLGQPCLEFRLRDFTDDLLPNMIANRGGAASTSCLFHVVSAPRDRGRAGEGRRIRCDISRDSQASTRQWRQYYRYLRYQKATSLPRVSWDRYHLSVLFVDRTDTVRAKVAAGIFDRIASWNGFGRALYPATAGVDPTGTSPDMATSAGLMAQAGLLKIPPKLFSRQGLQFEVEDHDRQDSGGQACSKRFCPSGILGHERLLQNSTRRWPGPRTAAESRTDSKFVPRNDIILATDHRSKERLRDILCDGVPDCQETMSKVDGRESQALQVAMLTDFKDYVGPCTLLCTGGSALLEPELKQIVEPALATALQATEISSPSLKSGAEEWNQMVQSIICSSAGLVQFLIDAWPQDLPDYDPL